jgi:hypothetical protein
MTAEAGCGQSRMQAAMKTVSAAEALQRLNARPPSESGWSSRSPIVATAFAVSERGRPARPRSRRA